MRKKKSEKIINLLKNKKQTVFFHHCFPPGPSNTLEQYLRSAGT